MPETVRQRIDHASLPLMTRLSRLPKLVPFAVLLTLLGAGLIIHGPIVMEIDELARRRYARSTSASQ